MCCKIADHVIAAVRVSSNLRSCTLITVARSADNRSCLIAVCTIWQNRSADQRLQIVWFAADWLILRLHDIKWVLEWVSSLARQMEPVLVQTKFCSEWDGFDPLRRMGYLIRYRVRFSWNATLQLECDQTQSVSPCLLKCLLCLSASRKY